MPVTASRSTIRAGFYLLIVTLLVFMLPILWFATAQLGANHDTGVHITLARHIAAGELPPLAHPLFHWLLIGTQAVTQLSWNVAGWVVLIAMYLLTALVIYTLLLDAMPLPADQCQHAGRSAWLMAALTFALMLVSAITVLTWLQQNLYFGYLISSAYHSPTTIVLRPFALLSFIYTAYVLNPARAVSATLPPGIVLTGGLAAVAAALAKPSYAICIIPAAGLFWLYWLYRRRTLNWPALLGTLLPTGLILVVQFFALPASGGDAGAITWMPLGFFADFHPLDVLLRLGLSVAFPLAVYLAYWPQARRDGRLNLAWLTFLFGAFYTYFIVEGNRVTHGNFTWSGQITLFILFVISAAMLVQQAYREQQIVIDRRSLLCGGVLLLHLISGVLWLAVHYSTESLVWY